MSEKYGRTLQSLAICTLKIINKYILRQIEGKLISNKWALVKMKKNDILQDRVISVRRRQHYTCTNALKYGGFFSKMLFAGQILAWFSSKIQSNAKTNIFSINICQNSGKIIFVMAGLMNLLFKIYSFFTNSTINWWL